MTKSILLYIFIAAENVKCCKICWLELTKRGKRSPLVCAHVTEIGQAIHALTRCRAGRAGEAKLQKLAEQNKCFQNTIRICDNM